jgi:cell division protease FtsH
MSDRNQSSEDPNEQQGQPPGGAGFGYGRLIIWIAIVALLGAWLFSQSGLGQRADQLSYTEFRQAVEDGRVAEVTVQGEQINGTMKPGARDSKEQPSDASGEGEGAKSTGTEFLTYLPSFGDEKLLAKLEQQGVTVNTKPARKNTWLTVLISFAPFLLLIALGVMFMRRMQSQGQQMLSMNKRRPRKHEKQLVETQFDDVAGAESAKQELQEIVEFLKRPESFRRLGGEPPKGVLLIGPPGTGKTLLARATSGEAGVPFYDITGSDFMEMFVGVGASRVRDLFDDARKNAPSIIFIDELDSIGRQRGAGLGGGHDEREQTLNQLLSEMDGFRANEGVIVMAATNRPDILDPALQRPGRFDRRVEVPSPNLGERLSILKIHAKAKTLADDVDLEAVARGTAGFSGADLQNLINEAALLAARREKDAIDSDDLEEARDKVLLGLQRGGVALSKEEWRLVAYHEAGHAVVAQLTEHAEPVHKVTIVPRGRAMGVTQQVPEEERYVYGREYLIDRMTVMMGGRAAERLIFDTATSGAENDLKQATQLARKMVLDWGMSDRLPNLALGDKRDTVFLGEQLAQGKDYSEKTAFEVDEAIRSIVDQVFEQASKTLHDYREALDRVAEELMEHEEIAGARVAELVQPESSPSPQREPAGG